jgi:NCAIR mutase (PurE)-related protein
MNRSELERLLGAVRSGQTDIALASNHILTALRAAPYEDLGFARVDTHRHWRQGFPEVVLGIGKTPAQIAAIAERLVSRGQTLLVTRAAPEAFEAVQAIAPAAAYHPVARTIALEAGDVPRGHGTVLIVCAGTSDLPGGEPGSYTPVYTARPRCSRNAPNRRRSKSARGATRPRVALAVRPRVCE